MANFSVTSMLASTTSIGRLNFFVGWSVILAEFPSYITSSLLVNSSADAWSTHAIASWPERPSQGCLMRNTQPPHLLVSTVRGKGIDQRGTNDAQYSCRGPRQAVAWPR